MDSNEYLDVREVADLLGVTPGTVRGYCRRGELASVRRGARGRRLVTRRALDTFLGMQPEEPAPADDGRERAKLRRKGYAV